MLRSSHCVMLQEAEPRNGKDVKLKLVLHSESSDAVKLSVNIIVQAMRYNGQPAAEIKHQEKNKTLLPGTGESSSVDIFLDVNVAVEFLKGWTINYVHV